MTGPEPRILGPGTTPSSIAFLALTPGHRSLTIVDARINICSAMAAAVAPLTPNGLNIAISGRSIMVR